MNSLIEKWMRICIIMHVIFMLFFIEIICLLPLFLTGARKLVFEFTDELCFIEACAKQSILIKVHLLIS